MDTQAFRYLPPRKIAENLWEIRGEWKNKLGRRMTIARLQGNRVAVHSSIKLKNEELQWLNALGTVTYIIAPNTFHCSDAGWMATTFPQGQLYVPKEKFSQFGTQNLKPKDVNVDFPKDLSGELLCIPMYGTRISEAAFLHVPSRTLILCDLAFNMADVFTGFEKTLMRWNKVGVRFGPTRLTKLLFTKNSSRLIESYNNLLTLDFDRVIVNHGEILETGGKALLRSSVAEIFGKKR